jgi:hypothetical protein
MSGKEFQDCRECANLGQHTNRAGCILAVQAAQAAMEELQAAQKALGTDPLSAQVMRTYESVKALAESLRENADAGWGEWGAIRCLENALYDLWGAYGYLAIEEGLLQRD